MRALVNQWVGRFARRLFDKSGWVRNTYMVSNNVFYTVVDPQYPSIISKLVEGTLEQDIVDSMVFVILPPVEEPHGQDADSDSK